MLEYTNTNGLQKVIDGLRELDGGKLVKLTELFPSSFMKDCSRFSSISDFFDKSPFVIKTTNDLESLSKSELDKYVSANTKFGSWEEMKEEAGRQYVLQQLGF